MTNTVVQKLIDLYGNRICGLVFDNQQTVYLGYGDRPSITDLELETIEGTDVIKIRYLNGQQWFNSISGVGKSEQGVTITIRPTECLQAIHLVEAGFEAYGVDPIAMR